MDKKVGPRENIKITIDTYYNVHSIICKDHVWIKLYVTEFFVLKQNAFRVKTLSSALKPLWGALYLSPHLFERVSDTCHVNIEF